MGFYGIGVVFNESLSFLPLVIATCKAAVYVSFKTESAADLQRAKSFIYVTSPKFEVSFLTSNRNY